MKHYKIIIISALLFTLAVPSALALTVNSRNTCDKGIHPFNSTLPYSEDNSAIAHKYNQDCRNDMEPFPGQHKQPVNPETNNPAKNNVDVSGFMHEHIYWNDSNQNDGTNNYYYAYVSRFEITLEADFMKNVDLSTLRCAPPPKDPYDERTDSVQEQALNDFKDCDGYDSIMWGGTRVTRVGNKITYTFGTEYADWKPILPGKNPSIDEGVYFNGNTLSENSTSPPYSPRLLGFQIDGYTKKNITDKAWSATTTSRALIKHLAIPQNAFSTGKDHHCFQTGYNKTNSWCPVNVSSSFAREPGYSQETHWFPIGTVSTVWKDFTPPPTCASATLTAKQDGQEVALSALEPNKPITFNVTPAYTPSDKSIPLKYKWTAKAPGLFGSAKGNFRDTPTTPNQPADGTFIDDDTEAYYTGSDDVVISVQALYEDGTPAPECKAQVQIEKEIKFCTGLQITSPGEPTLVKKESIRYDNLLLADTPTIFKVEPTFFQDKPVSLDYKWEATNTNTEANAGGFLDSQGAPPGENPYIDTGGLFIDDRSTFYTGGEGGTYIIVRGVDPETQEYVENGCISRIYIPPAEKKATCESLTISPTELTVPGATELEATVKFDDGKFYNTTVEWQGSNGLFLSDEPVSKSNSQSSSSLFTETFTTDEEATESTVKATVVLVEGAENSDACTASIEGVKVVKPVCKSITLTPSVPNAPGTTDLEATVTFDDEKDYLVTVEFSGENGVFKNEEESSSITQSSETPFTESFTTEELSAGITAKVTNILAENVENSDKCQNGITIRKTTVPECRSLKIMRESNEMPDEIFTTDPTDNLYLEVDKTENYELDYIWTVDGEGELTSAGGTAYTTYNPEEKVTLSKKADGTKLDVIARLRNSTEEQNEIKTLPQCSDSFTVNKPEMPGQCVSINVTPNKSQVFEGESVNINSISANYSGNESFAGVKWSQNGSGTFTKIGSTLTPSNTCDFVPSFCPADPTKVGTIPSCCRYTYTASPKGVGDSFSIEAVPNDDPVNQVCKFTMSVQKEDQIICTSNNIFKLNKFDEQKQEICVDTNYPNPQFRWYVNGTPQQGQTGKCLKTNGLSNIKVVELSNSGVCKDSYAPLEKELCKSTDKFKLFPFDEANQRICVDTDYKNAEYVWLINEQRQRETGRCLDTNGKSTIIVLEKSNPKECNDKYEPPIIPPETPPNPPTIEKEMKIGEFTDNQWHSSSNPITIGSRTNIPPINYKITVTPDQSTNKEITVRVVDKISRTGEIKAEILPSSGANKIDTINKSKIEFRSPAIITEGSNRLQRCNEGDDEEEDPPPCYNNNIDEPGGIELVGISKPVTIEYTGQLITGLTNPICENGEVCEEKYINYATIEEATYNGENILPGQKPTSRRLTIQLFCEYILTRAAGDIFLEEDLGYGVDILQCSDFSSSTGLIITPGPEDEPTLISSGAGGTEGSTFAITHEICSQGQTAGGLTGDAANLYGQEVVKQLSSQICEVKLRPGGPWRQQIITNSIEENKARIARWEADPSLNATITGANTLPSNQNVFYYKDRDVRIQTTDLIISDGQGAKTFIIENGDLIIDANIKYDQCNKPFCTVRDTASLAFIVLNGNIIINPNVKEISGVFYVQEGTTADTGKLKSKDNQVSTESLLVKGSIYGDILPLFQKRAYSGDPGEDKGGIVIRFDERIFLNTPPGIGDVVDLSQTEVAR